MLDNLYDGFTELYYGQGLDEGLSPDEFMVKLHEAVDQWFVFESYEVWKIYNGDEDNDEELEE